MATLRTRTEQYKRPRTTNRNVYGSYRWTKYSLQYRKANPLCAECLRNGITKLSNVVDHITPIAEGGEVLDSANHQALCTTCHNSKTARENKGWNKHDYE